MDRRLIIVARNQLPLCDYLRQQFAGDRDVELILDRRWRERRQRAQPYAWERRRADRRQGSIRDADLHTHGFAVIRRKSEVPALGEIETLPCELQKHVDGTPPRRLSWPAPEKLSTGTQPAEPSAPGRAPDSAQDHHLGSAGSNGTATRPAYPRAFVAAHALHFQQNPTDWEEVIKKIGIASLRLPENGALCAPWVRFLNELRAAG